MIEVDDIGGHPDLPDFNLPGRWERIATAKAASYPAWVTSPYAEPSDEEPKPPPFGEPGEWVTILYHGAATWAWVPSVAGPEEPDGPEVEPPDVDEPERAPKA